ncbi:MAG: hypothetical protein M1840_008232 [Geoglossum simile]|nr:MAG: hypothetical protein M1840_008232 [Geoglossum simile]
MESPTQLLVEDMAMGFDYMCSRFRTKPSSAASPILGDRPRMSISSIVNPSSVTVVGGEFDSASSFGPSATEMDEPAPTWPELYNYCNPNYQTSQDFFGVPCDTSVDYSFQVHTADSSPYDYCFPIDCNGEAMSLTCPRSYQPEFEMAPTETIIQSIEAYPPYSYVMDPQKHQSYMAISPHPIGSDPPVASQDQETLHRLQMGYGSNDALYGGASPAPSSDIDRTESRVSPCNNKDRASEGRDPLSAMGDDLDGGENHSNQPYAQLIYKALMSAPEHKMVLNEIYDWFRNTYEKFNKDKGKGWQNSIRHNLSMNGAFTKVEKSDDSAKGFIWVLEPSAIREGVKSTTRYRKIHTGRKGGSGAKAEGGVQALLAATAAASWSSSSTSSSSSSARRSGKPTKKIWKARAGSRARRNERAATAAPFGGSSCYGPQSVTMHSSPPQQPPPPSASSLSCSPHLTDPNPSWACYDNPPYIKQEHPPFLFQDIVGVSALYGGEPFFCEPSSVGEEFECGLAGGFFGDMTDGV